MKLFHRLTLYLATSLTLSSAALAQEASTAQPASELTLFGLLQQGGWAMWPLGLSAAFMLFLIFYCWRDTSGARFVPKSLLRPLTDALVERDVQRAHDMSEETPTVLTRALATGLLKARPQLEDANKDKVEAAFVDALEAEDSGISQWVNYLNVVAAVAPMLGLLGTVSGMINAFQTIGQIGMGDPTALAGDIGEALITTATGLSIGIPAMIFYFIFRNRLSTRMVETITTGGNLIDALAGELNPIQEEVMEESEA